MPFKNLTSIMFATILLFSACKSRVEISNFKEAPPSFSAHDWTTPLNAEELQVVRHEIDSAWKNGLGDSFACQAALVKSYSNWTSSFSPFSKLLIEEVVAIHDYTQRGYKVINSALRTQDESKLHERTATIHAMVTGLEKLPQRSSGVANRAANLSMDVVNGYHQHCLAADVFAEPTFISSTYDSLDNAVFKPFTGNVEFVIQGKSGKVIDKISYHPDESEVLFPPGHFFKVKSITVKPVRVIWHDSVPHSIATPSFDDSLSGLNSPGSESQNMEVLPPPECLDQMSSPQLTDSVPQNSSLSAQIGMPQDLRTKSVSLGIADRASDCGGATLISESDKMFEINIEEVTQPNQQ